MRDDDDLILLAVCTRDRPRMLRRCLASVAAQLSIPGARLAVLVVDNGDDPAAADARAAAAEAGGPFAIEVVHQPVRGISHARNRALEGALARGAVALMFLDDDQTIPPEWAATLVRVWREEGTDAVETPVTWQFEGSGRYRSFFERRRDRPGTAAREVRDGVPSTNGVLIARRLFDGLGLRFSPELALTGGEDTLFFEQAQALGARFILTRETRAFEHCPVEKDTAAWIMRRGFRIGCTKHLRRSGRLRRLRYGLKGVLALAIAGPLALVTAPFPLVSIHFAESAARGAGHLVGALGWRYEEYRRVVGG